MLYMRNIRRRELGWCRICLKECGCHHIYTHVSALCGENSGDEKLKGPVVVEFAVGVGVGGAEDAKKLAGASVASDG